MSGNNLYRSERRSRRIVFAIDPPQENADGGPSLKAGVFEYRQNGPRFSDIVGSGRAENAARLAESRGLEYQKLTNAFDSLYLSASAYIPIIYHDPYADVSPVQDVLFPCFHKSLTSLYVAHELSREGLYGPARVHLRHAFESLMIAKYCSVNPHSDVFDKWVDGKDIYFANAILKKIEKPIFVEIPQFWKLLCQWSHSTAFSGQPNVAFDEEQAGVDVNIGVIGVMLRWAAHLLGSHMATPSVRYYAKRYSNTPKTTEARKQLNEFFSWQRPYLGAGAKALISEYRATWKVV